MKRICTICARGGSKGVVNKNIRPLLGRALISYSVKQALDSGLFENIAVSSDSSEILEAARNAGADTLVPRPEELATDTAAKLPVIQHCFSSAEKILNKKFDTIVDLDATSPLRSVEDIKGAVALFESGRFSNVITGAKARRSPYFNLVEQTSDGGVRVAKMLDKPIVRRQDAPVCYDLNASIYVWSRQSLLGASQVINSNTGLYEMPENRSIDIDSEHDFQWVEFLMSKQCE